MSCFISKPRAQLSYEYLFTVRGLKLLVLIYFSNNVATSFSKKNLFFQYLLFKNQTKAVFSLHHDQQVLLPSFPKVLQFCTCNQLLISTYSRTGGGSGCAEAAQQLERCLSYHCQRIHRSRKPFQPERSHLLHCTQQ